MRGASSRIFQIQLSRCRYFRFYRFDFFQYLLLHIFIYYSRLSYDLCAVLFGVVLCFFFFSIFLLLLFIWETFVRKNQHVQSTRFYFRLSSDLVTLFYVHGYTPKNEDNNRLMMKE